MDLTELRVFRAVVRHRTVHGAAVALELAPSSVSARIRGLEESLGVALFARTSRGMRPTEAGERLLPWAVRLLDQAEQARADVVGSGPVLRLGALESLAAACLPGVLARLAARRPDVRVRVVSSVDRAELLADVSSGELEAALILDNGTALGGLGFPVPPDPVAFVDVDDVPLVLAAAPGHPLAGHPRLTPDDLARERLLVNAPACSFRLAADLLLGPGPERVPAGGPSVMRAWAEQGLGIALLPDFAVASALAAGSLVRLPLDVPPLALRLVWHSARETLPGLRDVLYAAAS
ncbi:DNA-binding transcriptional LysR family regulator [Actinocorallia herbida]|uniref:DNA-binding transcriptional LysR family regulator n=1 Tax=Actinocorallia herbida TaxID=58109 RepID=A0A3N1CYB6_9ACTN|nr:LysR family transcriptional regulator [Actinocorallia herbida]ROO85728.1 DNA-binding transcriptional LysR family regulator [Actinocorallia herbida]